MDFVLYQHRWAHFINRLQSDWAKFVLYVSIPRHYAVVQLIYPIFTGGSAAERQHGVLGHTKH